MSKKDIIICRCEDISLEQIEDALKLGYDTFEDLKRILRVGMGPCQANTCGHLAQKILAKHLNVSVDQVPIHKVRPLVLGVPLNKIAKED
jgi:bacterioferritin-associated ferredoxin